jgi:y4mF family transcriptional regulator
MAKEPPKITAAQRLTRSLETRRAQQAVPVATPALRAEFANAARPKKSPIKYPNTSTALRKQVEEMRKTDKSVPAVRLRVRPAPEPVGQQKTRLVTSRAAEILPAPGARKFSPARVSLAQRSEPAREPTIIRTALALGDVVRHARRRHGLSQGDLAAAAGTGRRFISELEAGKQTLEFERLLKVCNALGITLLASEAER